MFSWEGPGSPPSTKVAKRSPWASRKPAATEGIASAQSGSVITAGDSWAWAASSLRGLPQKVISHMRAE